VPVVQDGVYLGQPGAGRWQARPAIGTHATDLIGALP
jgi:hypothetical protein